MNTTIKLDTRSEKTEVYVGDSRVEGVINIDIDQINKSSGLITLELTVYPQKISIKNASLERLSLLHPRTGVVKEVKKIEYIDGSSWESSSIADEGEV